MVAAFWRPSSTGRPRQDQFVVAEWATERFGVRRHRSHRRRWFGTPGRWSRVLHTVMNPMGSTPKRPWGIIAAVATTEPTTEQNQYSRRSHRGSVVRGLKVYSCSLAATTRRPPAMKATWVGLIGALVTTGLRRPFGREGAWSTLRDGRVDMGAQKGAAIDRLT